MRLIVVCLVAATLLWPALAHAPDADFECIRPGRTDPSPASYSEDQRILFDTWNYENLLGSGGRLQMLNIDGEGNGWTDQPSLCREQLRICDYLRPTQPQNNWVFTQYISYLEAREVNVDVTYDYTSCVTNRGNGCNTLQTTMYLYERNGSDNNGRTNPANYNELRDLSVDNRGTFTETFTFEPSATGFYLGVQDTGTCGTINRITLYYRVCPARSIGLGTTLDIPFPPAGSAPTRGNIMCADNSIAMNPEVSCAADGTFAGNPDCRCDPGFESMTTSCSVCRAGTYRSASDPHDSCLICPDNTDTTGVKASICPCRVGYYRTANEGAGDRCTTSPSAVENSRSTSQSDTTISIRWEQPDDGDRDDLYYIIEYRPQGSLGSFIRAGRREDTGVMVYTYTIRNLEPNTNYLITVTAENGVSDQEPDLRGTRTVEIRALTLEGVPGPPRNCRGICTAAVWQEPEQPNGVITRYEIQFFKGGSPGRIIRGSDEVFYVVEDGDIPSGACGTVTFQVRAGNSRHTGPWCVQVPLGCPEPPTPTCPETPTPTCPETPTPTCPEPPTLTCPEPTTPTACPECYTVSISVEYDPPDDFNPGSNEYRAASGPVTVTCTATGPGTGTVSYQWSSTCRNCPFTSATSSTIRRGAVHSGDNGTHTCVATRGDCTARASIDFNVVDAGVHVFQGSRTGNLPSNGLVVSDNPGSEFRLRIFCRSDSMSENVGQLIGLDSANTSSNNFFAIGRQQPGELSIENRVGSQSSLTASQQGVYTCRIPLQNGKMKEINFGLYPTGFSTRPTIVSLTSASLSSFSTLTCTTAGSPATTVTWTRGGQPLTIDGHAYSMVQRVTNRAASTYDNVLIVSGPALGSTFTCTVTNTLGSDTSTITVTGTPQPPVTPVTPDINECNTNNGGCSQMCTNTQGSRVCSCRTGYTLASDGRTCLDINECNTNNGGCSQRCTNLQGSRRCDCNSGFVLAGDGRTCQDINECNTNNGGCSQICTNTPGSRQCSCRPGYRLASNGRTCSDINECSPNNGDCLHTCANIPGSRECSCRPGFVLDTDGRTCLDINECNTNNGECAQTCTNTQGSHQCSCRSGFTLASNGRICQDINECNTNNGGCSQMCTNTHGSRVCSCRAGYTLAGDGRTCLDINECNTNNGGCSQTCTNTQGSRECSCRTGYRLDGDGSTCLANFTCRISVEYSPPDDFTPGPNEYRAGSGPVTVICKCTGPETGTVSCQWSSTCRNCPFQSSTSCSIRRVAVHSGDTGTHTCVGTQNRATASACLDFHVVDAGMQLFRGSPRGNLPNNGLAITDNPTNGFRLRIFCRSDSMSENVGWFIGPNVNITSNNFFAIARPQPGEVTLENIVERNSPITAFQQGVYTCYIPLESGVIRKLSVGIYPSGFNIPPSTMGITSTTSDSGSSSNLTCTTAGSPATKVTWQMDGETLTIDGSTYQLTQAVTDRALSTYENVLTINRPVVPDRSRPRNFTCAVENALGSSATSALITI